MPKSFRFSETTVKHLKVKKNIYKKKKRISSSSLAPLTLQWCTHTKSNRYYCTQHVVEQVCIENVYKRVVHLYRPVAPDRFFSFLIYYYYYYNYYKYDYYKFYIITIVVRRHFIIISILIILHGLGRFYHHVVKIILD